MKEALKTELNLGSGSKKILTKNGAAREQSKRQVRYNVDFFLEKVLKINIILFLKATMLKVKFDMVICLCQ